MGGGRPFPPRPATPEKPESLGKDKPDRLKATNKNEFIKKKDRLKELEDLKREKQAEQKIQAKLLKKKREEQELAEKVTEVYFGSQLTVGELAEKLNFSVAEVIKELMMSGIMATVNQTIDIATAKLITEKLGLTVIEEEVKSEEAEEEVVEKEIIDETKLKERAPIVTIMGHVDHGKTTLLDSIRKSKQKIVTGEVGGITQSIGAYTATVNNKKIVFIDTPGHVDFTAEVERSLRVLDGAIVVFDAEEGVQSQSETVWHQADKYNVPRICFINKMDKLGADFHRTVGMIRSRLGANPAIMTLPIGKEHSFTGVIDLLTQKSLIWGSDELGAEYDIKDEIPDDMKKDVIEYRHKLIEQICEQRSRVGESSRHDLLRGDARLEIGVRHRVGVHRGYHVYR